MVAAGGGSAALQKVTGHWSAPWPECWPGTGHLAPAITGAIPMVTDGRLGQLMRGRWGRDPETAAERHPQT